MSETPMDLDAIEQECRAAIATYGDRVGPWDIEIDPETILALIAEVRRLRALEAVERAATAVWASAAWCSTVDRGGPGYVVPLDRMSDLDEALMAARRPVQEDES